jgi:hypothetical protein
LGTLRQLSLGDLADDARERKREREREKEREGRERERENNA